MVGSRTTLRQCVLLSSVFFSSWVDSSPTSREALIERLVFFMLAEEPEALRLELEGLKRQCIDIESLSGDSINLDGRWYTSLAHLLVSFPTDIGPRYPRWKILRDYKAAALWPKHAGSDHAKHLLNPDYVFGALITELAENDDYAAILDDISLEVVTDKFAMNGIFGLLAYLITAKKHLLYYRFLKASHLDLFSVKYEVRKPQFGVLSSILELFEKNYDNPSYAATLSHACYLVENAASKSLDIETSISLRTKLAELKERFSDAQAITKTNYELRASWRRAVFSLMRKLVHQLPPLVSEFTHALRLLDFDEESWQEFTKTDELGRNFFHVMLEGNSLVGQRQLLIAGQKRQLQIKRKIPPDVTRLLGILLAWGMRIDPNLMSSRDKYFRQALCSRGSAFIGLQQGQAFYLEASPIAMAAMMGYRGFVGDSLAFLSDARAYERDDHVIDKAPLPVLLAEAAENFVRASCYEEECWSEKNTSKVCQEKHEFLDKKWLPSEKKAREKFILLSSERVLADIKADLENEMESTSQCELKIKKAARVLAAHLRLKNTAGLYHMSNEYKMALVGNCLLFIFKKVAKGLEEGDLYSLSKESVDLLIDNAELFRFGSEMFATRLKLALIDAIDSGEQISFSQAYQREHKSLGMQVLSKLRKAAAMF